MIDARKIKLIHLMSDDKVIDSSIDLFDSNDMYENIFIVYLSSEKTIPIYVKSNKIILVHDTNDTLKHISFNDKVDGIMIHSYNNIKAKTILELKKIFPKSKIFWFTYGHDFYPKIKFPLYDKRTRQLLLKKDVIKFCLKKLLKPFLISTRYWYKAIPLIDYCSTVIPNEYNYLLKIKGFRAERVKYSFSSPKTKNYLLNKSLKMQIGNNVLIGNSANPSNNHLDIFQRIADEELPGKIIVPLSYSGGTWYKDIIIKEGKLLFGEYFYPLVEFMQKEDYFDLISSCSVAIFNHYRQQAVGNITAMFCLGARIYLSEKSIVYQYYRSLGYHIFSLECDFKKYKFSKLEIEKINENREKREKINNKKEEKFKNVLNGILQKFEK